MSFATIHTTAGLLALVQSQALGMPINLTEMSVGDGLGVAVTPDPDQTGLVRERFRAVINRIYKPDPSGRPNAYAAELVIPAAEGGFTLREVGLFDANGTLFVVGSLPETYKPVANEGAFADTVVRVEFEVSNAAVITLVVDPNVSIATQTWVANNANACSIIPGGTTGQVLRKATNGCGDTEWADPTDVNVTVSTIEEFQTLATGQTQVDLVIVNTAGLAVYIDGLRLPLKAGADGWQPDGSISSRMHLGQAYDGSEIIAVQNEPASDLPDALLQAQNLADVLDKALGRANLGVLSIEATKQRTPAGALMDFAMSAVPTGWLRCNGATIGRAAYAELFAAIGTAWGVGDGSLTFNLPDLRGEFRRGWDDGRGVDPNRAFSSSQSDAFRSHTHLVKEGTVNPNMSGMQDILASGDDYTRTVDHYSKTISTGGAETRPRNVAVLSCIKF